MYNRSYEVGKLPSEIIGAKTGGLLQYCLDRAVLLFGEAIKNDIRERTKNDKSRGQSEAKVKLILGEWLRDT